MFGINFGIIASSNSIQVVPDGFFFALNQNQGYVLVSQDGVSWTGTQRYGYYPTSSSNGCADVAYGNGYFLAPMMYSSTWAKSTDMLNWDTVNAPEYKDFSRAVFVNGRFFIYPEYTDKFYTSSDGLTWTSISVDYAGYLDVVHGSGVYILYSTHDRYYVSTDGLNWSRISLPSVNYFGDYAEDIIYDHGKFLVLYSNGKTYYSENGYDWTLSSMLKDQVPTVFNYEQIAFGNDKYIAVSPYGVVDSTDGLSWGAVSNPFTNPNQSGVMITYGNGKFIAGCAYYGQVYSSTDGLVWDSHTLPMGGKPWKNLRYIGNKFVITAMYENVYSTSTDGITWTPQEVIGALPGQNYYTPFYGNGKFIAYKADWQAQKIVYSTDATSWQYATNPEGNPDFYDQPFNSILWTSYSNNEYRAFYPFSKSSGGMGAGSTTTYWGGTLKSTDAISWIQGSSFQLDAYFSTGSNANNREIVMQSDKIKYSTDAINWNTSYLTYQSTWNPMGYGAGKYVTTDSAGDGLVLQSTDLNSWSGSTITNQYATVQDPLPQVLGGMAGSNGVIWGSVLHDGNQFIYSGAGSNLLKTTDLVTWNKSVYPGYHFSESASAYGNGIYVIKSQNDSYVWRSTDSVTWTSASNNDFNGVTMYGMIFDGTSFVLYGTQGLYWKSTDAITWTGSVKYGVTPWAGYENTAYDPSTNRIVAIDAAYSVFKTIDATTGQLLNEKSWPSYATDIVYANGKFVASHEGGNVSVSTDGITWTSSVVSGMDPWGGAANYNWTSIAYGNGIFVMTSIMSWNGSTAVSTDAVTWTSVNVGNATVVGYNLLFANGEFHKTHNSNIWSSTDGINWYLKKEGTPFSNGYWDRAFVFMYENGLYVAHFGYSALMFTSTDLITWSAVDAGLNGEGFESWTGGYYNGKYYITQSYRNKISVSTDGTTWTIENLIGDTYRWMGFVNTNSGAAFYGNWSSIKYTNDSTTNGVFLPTRSVPIAFPENPNAAIGKIEIFSDKYIAFPQSDNFISYSTDLIAWQKISQTGNLLMDSYNPRTAHNNQDMIISVSSYKQDGRYMYSTDGLTWQNNNAPWGSNEITGAAYGNGKFIVLSAVFKGGTGPTGGGPALPSRAYLSTDGLNWNTTIDMPIGQYTYYMLNYNNGVFAALSRKQFTYAYSTDGITWGGSQGANLLPIGNYREAVYGNGKWVATTSYDGSYAVSTDLINWNSYSWPNNQTPQTMKFGNGLFIASRYSDLLKSTDAITWDVAKSTPEYYALTFGV